MTTVSGNNVTISSTDFISYKDLILTRDSLTADSVDLTPTANDLTGPINGPPYTINYSFYIFNSSPDYKITLTSNTGFSIIPGPTDIIYPNTIKKYDVKILNENTVEVYNMDYNGTPITAEKIKVTDDPVVSQDVVNLNYLSNYNPIISVYDATGDVPVGNTTAGILYDTVIIEDASDYSFNSGSGVIEFLTSGTFSISYSVVIESANTSGGARSGFVTNIQSGTSGTGPWTEILGSLSGNYFREGNDGQRIYGTSKTIILNITSGTFLRVTVDRNVGSSIMKTTPTGSSLSILKIRN